MHSQDLMNQDNNRADAIKKLMTFCLDNNFSYNYTDKTFTITLPTAEPLPVTDHITTNKRKKFDISGWGERGIVEGEEPDSEQPLEEGTPPEGQL